MKAIPSTRDLGCKPSAIHSFRDEPVECLPLLHYIIEKGNTTTYQYRTGVAPSTVEETQLNFSVGEEDVDESKTEEVGGVKSRAILFKYISDFIHKGGIQNN